MDIDIRAGDERDAREGRKVTAPAGQAPAIGILFDAPELSGGPKALVQHLLAADQARLFFLARHNPDARREGALWRLIDGVERSLSKRLLHGALARARGVRASLFDGGAINPAVLVHERLEQVHCADDSAISALKLDVIVDLCQSPTLVDPHLARLGVWRVVSSEAPSDRRSPFGFWSAYRGQPIAHLAIVASRGEGATEIASGAYSNFMWSWSLNDSLLGAKAALLIEDALMGVSRALERSWPSEPVRTTKRGLLHAAPGVVGNYARLVGEAAERALYNDRWRILLKHGDPLAPDEGMPATIEPPSHSYWADPFVLRRGDQCHLFFEEYLYAERRGVISHVCVNDPQPGQIVRGLKSTIILDRPHHLSYPFLFTHCDQLFMIPESSAAKETEIWRSTDFPHGWTKETSVLSGVSAADTSLLEWNGRWWMFTNIDRSGANDHRSELHVFYADDPIAGPWTPHAANPVVVDARCARMAGGFLKSADGRPIRCGQLQGRKYGERVSYRLITDLTESTYAETAIAEINPIRVTPGARTHHLVACDGMIVADECLMTPKWSGPRIAQP